MPVALPDAREGHSTCRDDQPEYCHADLQPLSRGQCSFGYSHEGPKCYREGANTPVLALGGDKAVTLGLQQPSNSSSGRSGGSQGVGNTGSNSVLSGHVQGVASDIISQCLP